jgi:hypothetical protein
MLHLSANPKHLSAQNGDKTMHGDSAPSPPKLSKQGSQLQLNWYWEKAKIPQAFE